MPDLKIDENLVEWDELSSQDWKNLLIGNGFRKNLVTVHYMILLRVVMLIPLYPKKK